MGSALTAEITARRVFDLPSAAVLIFERDAAAARLAGQLARGLGVGSVREIFRHDDAMAAVRAHKFDLIIADPHAANGRAMEFLRWLRRSDLCPNRFVPIILTPVLENVSPVSLMRTAGANFVIAKPYALRTLAGRVAWIGKDKRPFIDTPAYVGPCRRITPGGMPVGQKGRRASDALFANFSAA